MKNPPLILAIDDDTAYLQSIKKMLRFSGFIVRTLDNVNLVKDEIRGHNFSAILLDLQMPGITGLDLLKQIIAYKPGIPIIVVSGTAGIETAVEAIKLGAYDFLEKPVDFERLMIAINNALKHLTLNIEKEMLTQELASSHQILGESEATIKMKNEIKTIGASNIRALIIGESGTGKELVAWGIYHNSPRKNKPFIKLNCASIPHDLLESELFGYKKGSFTGAVNDKLGKFQAADGGTLFLDEIGELDISLQAKLLRVLEEGEIEMVGSNESVQVDVRIIAATNQDLPSLIREGKFREDLFHRLNVARIDVPPLRERKEDILPIAYHFIEKYNEEYNKKIRRISPQAEGLLVNHSWKGNVRELRNVIESTVLFNNSETIDVKEIIEAFNRSGYDFEEKLFTADGEFPDLKTAKNNFEKNYLLSVLRATDWAIGKAADIMAIDRSNLFKKMKQFGIQKPGEGKEE